MADILKPQKNVSNSKEKLLIPVGMKKIAIYFSNFILFILYWVLLQFIFGFCIGALASLNLFSSDILENDNLFSIIGLICLSIVVILSFIFRKSIYLQLVKK